MTELEMLGYVGGAMVLGGAIGFERELADKPAGMRTHMLVAGASALLVLVGETVIARYGNALPAGLVHGDPTRVVAAIVSGVAFLGAGAIIRHGDSPVYGLTTARTVLFTAAVGICVAARQLVLAVGATILALPTLRLLGMLEERLKAKLGAAPPASGDSSRGHGT
jgi:putative Mg2+ transporter-C (MgtC) family protein